MYLWRQTHRRVASCIVWKDVYVCLWVRLHEKTLKPVCWAPYPAAAPETTQNLSTEVTKRNIGHKLCPILWAWDGKYLYKWLVCLLYGFLINCSFVVVPTSMGLIWLNKNNHTLLSSITCSLTLHSSHSHSFSPYLLAVLALSAPRPSCWAAYG